MEAPTDPQFTLRADWLGLCRRALGRVESMLADTDDRAERTGTRGEGGDLSLVIDRAAEDAILAEIEALGLPVCVVTEERGQVTIAGGGPVRVVIDPIDGSLNARRRLPLYSVSVAVAGGTSMADVEFGWVHHLETGEEWWARRGEGAHLDDERVEALGGEREFEILGLESANPRIVAACADQLAATGARRLRAMGSIALSLAWVAGARFDAMLSLYDCRSVDAAAGQLIVREAGGMVSFPDAGERLSEVPLDLDMRSRVAAAVNSEILDVVLGAMPAAPPERTPSTPAAGA
ncbi:MAG TPA: inositol monophosphatase family protein [Thermoleophilaceae bacterium]|nr:inositol monophosphatase family protein [Thermoleophilaceae bacterium]